MENIIRIIKETVDKISAKSRLNKRLLLIVLMLVSGIIMLLASELSESGKTVSAELTQQTSASDIQGYSELLEERLTSIISSIEGAGATRVMITFENGGEDIYLHDSDYGENAASDGKNSVERKDEYVIIDGSEGERGIIVRRAEPEVRGVAVVCEGGGSETVRAQIIEAVTALLDISSARVSVAKLN